MAMLKHCCFAWPRRFRCRSEREEECFFGRASGVKVLAHALQATPQRFTRCGVRRDRGFHLLDYMQAIAEKGLPRGST